MNIHQYLTHLPNCNTKQDWSEAESAFASTPNEFRGPEFDEAVNDMNVKRSTCTCGYDKAVIALEHLEEVQNNTWHTRDFLMGVSPKDLKVEDVLEHLGFGRNGLA